MENQKKQLGLTILGAVVFSFLFWGESAGINMLLFSMFIFGGAYFMYEKAFKNHYFLTVLAGHFISALMVLFIHSDLSVCSYVVSFIICIGYIQSGSTRSILYASANSLGYVFTLPVNIIKNLSGLNYKGSELIKKVIRLFSFVALPLLIVLFFFLLYRSGNTVFESISNVVLDKIGAWLEYILDMIYIERVFFFILGFIITSLVFISVKYNLGYYLEKDCKDDLESTPMKRDYFPFNMISTIYKEFFGRMIDSVNGLKNEQNIALLTLILLNSLILINNILDITYVWFDDLSRSGAEASEMVHQGTGVLIFSIVMSMLVLMFYFRNKLNFIRSNTLLKTLAYAWIIQNAILVISVLDRDLYYINHYGLTYKRIGVLIYLLLTVIGLFTLYLKIRQQKTNYYLFRVNALVAFIVLITITCINWDTIIYNYNIKNNETVKPDYEYLSGLSDQLIPYTIKDIDKNDSLYYEVERQKELFMLTQKHKGWLSWNYRDQETMRKLE